tara:strand:+ start:2776 stop:5523 length:2748 start_codon:yes stop_codon:yes gene_type:complete
MADITNNNDQISIVSLGDTINDWRTLTNTDIIGKLNLMKVYDIAAATGLSLTGGFRDGGTGGTFEMSIADYIGKGITIDGNLVVTGNVSFSTAGEISFPNGIVNVNGDNDPPAGEATAGIVVGSFTGGVGPDWNSGTTHPYFLNYNGQWFTNQDLKLVGGGTYASATRQQIIFGEENGKTLSFKQTATDLIIGNGHTYDALVTGATLSGEIARIRASDGRIDILRGVNKRRVTGVSHGFNFGQVVRASDAYAAGFTLAVASGGATFAEAVGMISRVNGNSDFEVTFNGEVEGTFTSVTDGTSILSVGCPYFLSPTTAGNITLTEPSTEGHVSKPVFVGLSPDRGVLLNYRGQVINTVGGAGGGGGTADGVSVRTTISGSGFAVGDIIALEEQGGGYEKLNTSNKTRVFGLVVNEVSGGYELLLYGMSKDTDTFRDTIHTDRIAGDDPLLYMNQNNSTVGQFGLTTTNPTQDFLSPSAIVLGVKIFFFNTRFAAGYATPSDNNLNTTQRSSKAFTAAIVAGGTDAGVGAGAGGYVNSTTSGTVKNVMDNGAFDIWQRGIGVDAAHTGTAETYFADRWMRQSTLTGSYEKDFSIKREKFSFGQGNVLGNPEYYSILRSGQTGSTGSTFGDMILYSNIIEDANTYAGVPVTVSFYMKGATGVTGFVAAEYEQLWNGTPGGSASKQTLDLVYIDGATGYTRYALSFKPKNLPVGATTNPNDSYATFSLLPYRYNGSTGQTGSADVSYNHDLYLAKFQMDSGFVVTNPAPSDKRRERSRANRFYQTSYNSNDYRGKNTMVTGTNIPKDGSPSVTMNTSGNIQFTLIDEMRTPPTIIDIFSPTGVQNVVFNMSAGKDLNKTSGTKGYNSATRSVNGTGKQVSAASNSEKGFNLYLRDGAVAFDDLRIEYAAKAEYNTGVDA